MSRWKPRRPGSASNTRNSPAPSPCQFRGEEKTLAQMGRYLEEPDRPLRQEAWELTANRRLREAEQFENNFEQLLKLREQIAANAGFPNYLQYAFQARGRFDYTPGDCRKFHDAVEKEIMPAVRQLQAERRRQLGLPVAPPVGPERGSFEPPVPAPLRAGRGDGGRARRRFLTSLIPGWRPIFN